MLFVVVGVANGVDVVVAADGAVADVDVLLPLRVELLAVTAVAYRSRLYGVRMKVSTCAGAAADAHHLDG